jgi:CheY-like chemotaxis protein
VIVLLSGRSLFCHGLSVQLGLMNRPVASVPLSSSISQIARTLRRLRPELLIVDALEIRAAGFLFIDALRQDELLAACPILVVASGSFPDEDRFTTSAQARGLHVMLEAVSFEDLCEKVGVIVDQQTFALAAVAS